MREGSIACEKEIEIVKRCHSPPAGKRGSVMVAIEGELLTHLMWKATRGLAECWEDSSIDFEVVKAEDQVK